MIARRFATLSIFLGVLVFVEAAGADGNADAAKALFDRGIEHLETRKYDKACPVFDESYRLDPRPGTLFTLADCEAQLGRIATAVTRYDEYLALYATLSADKKARQGTRPQDAQAQRATLLPDIPQLTLVVPSGALPGVTVMLDGAKLDDAALGVPRAIDPGEHIVTARPLGGALKRITIRIEKRQKKTVKLDLGEGPQGSPPPPSVTAAPPSGGLPPAGSVGAAPNPPQGTGPNGRRIGAFVAGGVGAAGFVVGAVTGGLMLAQKSTIDARCDAGGGCRGAEGTDAGNAAKTFGLISSIGWVTGIAGLGAATVLFLTEPPRPKGPATGVARSRRSTGRWVSGGVLSVGPTGSTFGVQGAW